MGNSGNDVVALGYQAGKDNTIDNQFIVKQANINAIPLIQGDFNTGNVGIGTTSPTEALDINSDKIRIRTANTPASASATGAVGEICWDADYIYVCTATDTWKRTAIATW